VLNSNLACKLDYISNKFNVFISSVHRFRENINYRAKKPPIELYMQHQLPVMTALSGEICIERQPAKQAIQGKPMYLAIQGEGDHPEMKKNQSKKH